MSFSSPTAIILAEFLYIELNVVSAENIGAALISSENYSKS